MNAATPVLDHGKSLCHNCRGMRHSEAIDAVGDWEQRFPVHLWTLDGVPLWPDLRIYLAFQLMRPAARRESRMRAVRIPVTEALDAARALVADARDLRHAHWTTPTAEFVTLSSPTNRVCVGTQFHDRFFDPIADVVEGVGGRLLQLENHRHGTEYRLPRRRRSLLVRPLVVRENALAAGLHYRHVAELPEYPAFCEALRRSHPTLQIPGPRTAARRTYALLRVARAFGRLLERARPKLVLVSCYYNQMGMALCLAARRLGIPSLDLQHGVTLHNPAYAGWTRFPQDGYPQLPDMFWCWTDDDAAPVRGWPAQARQRHAAFVGGQPWASFWEGNTLSDEIAARVRALRGPGLNVLISLSDTFMPESVRATLRSAPADWTFWVRLHPGTHALRERTRAACAADAPGRCLLDDGTDLPLPLLLRSLDVHLTIHSTVVQEATAYGMPSVMLDPETTELFAPGLASGWLRQSDGGAPAIAALREQRERREQLPANVCFPSRTQFVRTVEQLLDDPIAFRDKHTGEGPRV